MKHSPERIADFARGTGIDRRLVAPLTAIALCASGGNDHYDMRAGMPGAGHWVGLWAIDTDRWRQLDGYDLADPYVSAGAAKYLTHTLCSLDWSPAYASGAVRHYRDAAVAAVAMPSGELTDLAPRAGHAVTQSGIVTELFRKAG